MHERRVYLISILVCCCAGFNTGEFPCGGLACTWSSIIIQIYPLLMHSTFIILCVFVFNANNTDPFWL
jgi:hypothetical protein